MLGLFFSSYPEIDPKDEELNFRNSLTLLVCVILLSMDLNDSDCRDWLLEGAQD